MSMPSNSIISTVKSPTSPASLLGDLVDPKAVSVGIATTVEPVGTVDVSKLPSSPPPDPNAKPTEVPIGRIPPGWVGGGLPFPSPNSQVTPVDPDPVSSAIIHNVTLPPPTPQPSPTPSPPPTPQWQIDEKNLLDSYNTANSDYNTKMDSFNKSLADWTTQYNNLQTQYNQAQKNASSRPDVISADKVDRGHNPIAPSIELYENVYTIGYRDPSTGVYRGISHGISQSTLDALNNAADQNASKAEAARIGLVNLEASKPIAPSIVKPVAPTDAFGSILSDYTQPYVTKINKQYVDFGSDKIYSPAPRYLADVTLSNGEVKTIADNSPSTGEKQQVDDWMGIGPGNRLYGSTVRNNQGVLVGIGSGNEYQDALIKAANNGIKINIDHDTLQNSSGTDLAGAEGVKSYIATLVNEISTFGKPTTYDNGGLISFGYDPTTKSINVKGTNELANSRINATRTGLPGGGYGSGADYVGGPSTPQSQGESFGWGDVSSAPQLSRDSKNNPSSLTDTIAKSIAIQDVKTGIALPADTYGGLSQFAGEGSSNPIVIPQPVVNTPKKDTTVFSSPSGGILSVTPDVAFGTPIPLPKDTTLVDPAVLPTFTNVLSTSDQKKGVSDQVDDFSKLTPGVQSLVVSALGYQPTTVKGVQDFLATHDYGAFTQVNKDQDQIQHAEGVLATLGGQSKENAQTVAGIVAGSTTPVLFTKDLPSDMVHHDYSVDLNESLGVGDSLGGSITSGAGAKSSSSSTVGSVSDNQTIAQALIDSMNANPEYFATHPTNYIQGMINNPKNGFTSDQVNTINLDLAKGRDMSNQDFINSAAAAGADRVGIIGPNNDVLKVISLAPSSNPDLAAAIVQSREQNPDYFATHQTNYIKGLETGLTPVLTGTTAYEIETEGLKKSGTPFGLEVPSSAFQNTSDYMPVTVGNGIVTDTGIKAATSGFAPGLLTGKVSQNDLAQTEPWLQNAGYTIEKPSNPVLAFMPDMSTSPVNSTTIGNTLSKPKDSLSFGNNGPLGVYGGALDTALAPITNFGRIATGDKALPTASDELIGGVINAGKDLLGYQPGDSLLPSGFFTTPADIRLKQAGTDLTVAGQVVANHPLDAVSQLPAEALLWIGGGEAANLGIKAVKALPSLPTNLGLLSDALRTLPSKGDEPLWKTISSDFSPESKARINAVVDNRITIDNSGLDITSPDTLKIGTSTKTAPSPVDFETQGIIGKADTATNPLSSFFGKVSGKVSDVVSTQKDNLDYISNYMKVNNPDTKFVTDTLTSKFEDVPVQSNIPQSFNITPERVGNILEDKAVTEPMSLDRGTSFLSTGTTNADFVASEFGNVSKISETPVGLEANIPPLADMVGNGDEFALTKVAKSSDLVVNPLGNGFFSVEGTIGGKAIEKELLVKVSKNGDDRVLEMKGFGSVSPDAQAGWASMFGKFDEKGTAPYKATIDSGYSPLERELQEQYGFTQSGKNTYETFGHYNKDDRTFASSEKIKDEKNLPYFTKRDRVSAKKVSSMEKEISQLQLKKNSPTLSLKQKGQLNNRILQLRDSIATEREAYAATPKTYGEQVDLLQSLQHKGLISPRYTEFNISSGAFERSSGQDLAKLFTDSGETKTGTSLIKSNLVFDSKFGANAAVTPAGSKFGNFMEEVFGPVKTGTKQLFRLNKDNEVIGKAGKTAKKGEGLASVNKSSFDQFVPQGDTLLQRMQKTEESKQSTSMLDYEREAQQIYVLDKEEAKLNAKSSTQDSQVKAFQKNELKNAKNKTLDRILNPFNTGEQYFGTGTYAAGEVGMGVGNYKTEQTGTLGYGNYPTSDGGLGYGNYQSSYETKVTSDKLEELKRKKEQTRNMFDSLNPTTRDEKKTKTQLKNDLKKINKDILKENNKLTKNPKYGKRFKVNQIGEKVRSDPFGSLFSDTETQMSQYLNKKQKNTDNGSGLMDGFLTTPPGVTSPIDTLFSDENGKSSGGFGSIVINSPGQDNGFGFDNMMNDIISIPKERATDSEKFMSGVKPDLFSDSGLKDMLSELQSSDTGSKLRSDLSQEQRQHPDQSQRFFQTPDVSQRQHQDGQTIHKYLTIDNNVPFWPDTPSRSGRKGYKDNWGFFPNLGGNFGGNKGETSKRNRTPVLFDVDPRHVLGFYDFGGSGVVFGNDVYRRESYEKVVDTNKNNYKKEKWFNWGFN